MKNDKKNQEKNKKRYAVKSEKPDVLVCGASLRTMIIQQRKQEEC